MPEEMQVIVAGRRNGKTTKALQWVREAQRVPHYPFWDRVLLVDTTREAQFLRIGLRQEAEEAGTADSGLYYNLVYSIDEWRTAHIDRQWEGLVAIDNVDLLLERMLRAKPALVTMTGESVHPVVPKELQANTVTPKMLRETLTKAQTALMIYGQHTGTYIDDDVAHLERLIKQIDFLRPLAVDGKHKKYHTPWCGCEGHDASWTLAP